MRVVQDGTRTNDRGSSDFEQHTGLQLHAETETVSGTKFLADGKLSVIVMPVAVRECKNEDGHAVNQATLYHAKSSEIPSLLIQSFSFSFLLQIQHPISLYSRGGRACILVRRLSVHNHLFMVYCPALGFYGAVWDGRVIRVEPLMPTFDLSTQPMDMDVKAGNTIACLDTFMEVTANITAHYVNGSICNGASGQYITESARHYSKDAHDCLSCIPWFSTEALGMCARKFLGDGLRLLWTGQNMNRSRR